MFRRLLILAALAAAGWWYWTRWRPAHNYKQFAGQLETAVNDELVRQGITDRQVLQTLRRERSQWGQSWVETHRRFEVNPRSVTRLLNALSAVATKQGCEILQRRQMPGGAVLEIGKDTHLLERLVFVPSKQATAALPPPKTPEVAFVIDDVAYDMKAMDHFAALNVPLTFAILPRDKNSKALAEKAHTMNFGVILHLPMEPIDLAHNDPGGAALYLKMTPEELHQQFEKDVASVPEIVGINNHMGSAFTEDAGKMDLVLHWVKEKGLFFLDSRTSTHSVVPKVAKQVGVPCLANETFLDNLDTVPDIEQQLDIVLSLALRHKRTIAIGHYRRKHLVEALANKIPEFKAKGVTLVTLPEFFPT